MLSGTHRFPRQDLVTYGRPAVEALRELAASWHNRRLLIVTTASLEKSLAAVLAEELGELCVGVFAGVSAHSPRESVIAGAEAARRAEADLLVAFGGGSAIDAAKVMQLCLWASITSVEELDPYRAGRGPDRVRVADIPAGVRMAAIPTTLSAAEFTPFAGVTDRAKQAKEGYAHPMLAPRGVILDAAVTLATPAELWFSTGLKAIDHAVEQLCNPQRAPYADALAEDALRRLTRGLSATKADPTNLDAREDSQFGMWLAMSGVGSGRGMGPSHAIGHTLGGTYGIPHGITSCIILPAVLKWSEGHADGRLALISELMGAPGRPASETVKGLVMRLGLPTELRSVGIGRESFQAIAEHTMHDAGIRTGARPITGPDDIVTILELAAG